MTEHILFLTGRLAEKSLQRTLDDMMPDFHYTVYSLGLSVAALMTADMIRRRLKDTFGADRVLVPGRCQGDLERLSSELGLPIQRGPEELHELPQFFGAEKKKLDLSRYDINLFSEIVDAPQLEIDGILRHAQNYKREGADVIDLGTLPETPFPHLAEAIYALKAEGFQVSVDSLQIDDLVIGSRAGADFLLSLQEETLWITEESPTAVPILIPATPGDIRSLDRAIASMRKKDRRFIVDPILDPIHFGFTESIVRYHQTRERYPEAELMMGVGNITELTHADTVGMNTLLVGICSELHIKHVLTTQVSHHTRRTVREINAARRILYAARESGRLPKQISDQLIALHDRTPFLFSRSDVEELYEQIKDPSYRILVTSEGMHLFNRDGLYTSSDPFALFPNTGLDTDGRHAFYLGVQLGRAQIAWQLGKRYTQDQPLRWGCQWEESDEPDLLTKKLD